MLGDHRQPKGELQREVAVAHGVETVGGHGVESKPRGHVGPVDRQTRARQARRRPAAARWRGGEQSASRCAVALELLAVRQPVVRGQNGLCPLEMGVAGQDHVGIRIAPAHERLLQRRQAAVDLVDARADPEPQVGGDLIVSAAGRMEFPAHVADPLHQGRLDVHVDIFEFGTELEPILLNFLADFLQRLLNLLAFVGRNQADLGEHLGVGDRALNILRIEPAVEAHALGELLDAAVRRLLEHAPPRFFSHASASRLGRTPRKFTILAAKTAAGVSTGHHPAGASALLLLAGNPQRAYNSWWTA